MKEERNTGIDLVKALATVAVVMIHGKNIYGYANKEAIYPIHFIAFIMSTGVPLFFLASGYLIGTRECHNKGDFVIAIKKICVSLVIPYILVNLFWLLFEIICSQFVPSFSDTVSLSPVDLVSYVSWRPVYSPFWFIRNLIIIKTFFVVLSAIHSICKIVFSTALILIGLIPIAPIDNHCRITLVFFCIGILLRLMKKQFDDISCCKRFILISILLFAPLVYLFNDSYIIRFYLLCFLSISEFALLINSGKRHKECKVISFVGTNSFFIYAFHGKLLSILQIFSVRTFRQSDLILVGEYFILPVFLVVVLATLSHYARLLSPRVFRIVTGGR